ncbi:MAG: histidine phosphatase family protein, partial [Bacteroidales bacterium]|nr:histidine phosphatase family protein [Bacteroidales bacterium]
MKTTTILTIIRHGETDWNSTGRLQGCEDIELNHTGRGQAHRLATYLGRENWDAIVSSPLKRAYETARIIASSLSLNKIEVIEKLRERDYGEASGLLPDERRSRFPNGEIPGQEPFEHLRARAMEAVNEISVTYA